MITEKEAVQLAVKALLADGAVDPECVGVSWLEEKNDSWVRSPAHYAVRFSTGLSEMEGTTTFFVAVYPDGRVDIPPVL